MELEVTTLLNHNLVCSVFLRHCMQHKGNSNYSPALKGLVVHSICYCEWIKDFVLTC